MTHGRFVPLFKPVQLPFYYSRLADGTKVTTGRFWSLHFPSFTSFHLLIILYMNFGDFVPERVIASGARLRFIFTFTNPSMPARITCTFVSGDNNLLNHLFIPLG